MIGVAPLAGAWIEIQGKVTIITSNMVAPLAGAWIEINGYFVFNEKSNMSLPLRERGLKSIQKDSGLTTYESLPLRERGLKSKGRKVYQRISIVAPLAGAWIEIVC